MTYVSLSGEPLSSGGEETFSATVVAPETVGLETVDTLETVGVLEIIEGDGVGKCNLRGLYGRLLLPEVPSSISVEAVEGEEVVSPISARYFLNSCFAAVLVSRQPSRQGWKKQLAIATCPRDAEDFVKKVS